MIRIEVSYEPGAEDMFGVVGPHDAVPVLYESWDDVLKAAYHEAMQILQRKQEEFSNPDVVELCGIKRSHSYRNRRDVEDHPRGRTRGY